jgi:hypothetical protein
MILLVTPSGRAAECAAALHTATEEEISVAGSLARATTLLRTDNYLAVVLDQHLAETGSDESETMLKHLGTAVPVHVNLAIMGMERLVREVRGSLHRRRRDEVRARRAVVSSLWSELNGTVTALLLSSELALETPDLPVGAAEKMGSVRRLVNELRSQLESAGSAEAHEQAVRA